MKRIICVFLGMLVLLLSFTSDVFADTSLVPDDIDYKEIIKIDTNTNDKPSNPLEIQIWRIYLFGEIHDLDTSNGQYSFSSNNIRKLEIFHVNGQSGFEFYHYTNVLLCFSGFNFRGIMKDNFICGYLYDVN